MEFSRQEYWSELSFPPPGDLPYPVIKCTPLMPPALLSVPPGKPECKQDKISYTTLKQCLALRFKEKNFFFSLFLLQNLNRSEELSSLIQRQKQKDKN